MKIIKEPTFENDSYMFTFNLYDKLAKVEDQKYLKDKQKAFMNFDKSKRALKDHFDRPSFGNVSDVKDLQGTVYTCKALVRNEYDCYDTMVSDIQKNKAKGRKCFLDFANPLREYLDQSINTSCLASIHFLNDRATVFFRASCMEHELLYDLHLIKSFFLKPVYGFFGAEITVVASTAQNIININKLFDNENEIRKNP